jgi:hypothetical protein
MNSYVYICIFKDELVALLKASGNVRLDSKDFCLYIFTYIYICIYIFCIYVKLDIGFSATCLNTYVYIYEWACSPLKARGSVRLDSNYFYI